VEFKIASDSSCLWKTAEGTRLIAAHGRERYRQLFNKKSIDHESIKREIQEAYQMYNKSHGKA
jgi:hypothetical protein